MSVLSLYARLCCVSGFARRVETGLDRMLKVVIGASASGYSDAFHLLMAALVAHLRRSPDATNFRDASRHRLCSFGPALARTTRQSTCAVDSRSQRPRPR